MATEGELPEERRVSGWMRTVSLYGFTLVFASVALVFGIWFGVQLMATQREGIVSINAIQDLEAAQAQQLTEMNARLDRLADQLAAAAIARAAGEGGTP